MIGSLAKVYRQAYNWELITTIYFKWIESEKPSIIVKGTAGRFGNILFTYMALLSIKVSFEIKFREIKQFVLEIW